MPGTKTPRTAPDPDAAAVTPVDLEPLIVASQRSLKAASQANGHLLKRLVKLNSELTRFVERRLQQDRKTARELAACTNAPDALAVYGRYFERAVKQYSDEMGLLAGVFSDQAREAMDDVQHQIEETVEPVADGAKPR